MGLVRKETGAFIRSLQISWLSYGLVLVFNHISLGMTLIILGTTVFMPRERPKWWGLTLFLLVELIAIYFLNEYFLKGYAHNGIPMEELFKAIRN